MFRTIRAFALAFAILALTTAACLAEFSVPVNSTGGVFDQPSSVANGTTVHVAFIGPSATPGAFSLYYASINGASDFTSSLLTRATTGFVVTPSFAILDNGYTDVRHPKIALLSADRVVILFQAKSISSPGDFRLFIAQLTLSNNAIVSTTVREAQGIPAGDVQDISFGIVAADNTARAAFSQRASGAAGGPFDVWYARISLDNDAVVRPPLQLSTFTNSNGSQPIPNLKLDAQNRSHIVWAAGGPTLDNSSSIYYAMVKEFVDSSRGNPDNAAIGATGVIDRIGHWTHPQMLVSPNPATQVYYVVAVDESVAGRAGNLAWVTLNPDAAPQDNNAVLLGTNNLFLLTPPGEAIPPSSFDLYRPEAHLDLGNRIHFTGYGDPHSAPLYMAVGTTTSYPYFSFLTPPTSIGHGSNAASYALDNDYSKAAFSFIGGKAVIFWSGTDNTNASNRNLMVTGLPTINEFVLFKEKGCSTAPGGQATLPDALAGILMLGVPLAALKLRSILRKRGRVAA